MTTAVPLFSADWFAGVSAQATEAFRAEAAAPGAPAPVAPAVRAGLAVEYRCEHSGGEVVLHHLFRRGRLAQWGRGAPPDGADLVLRQQLPAHLALLTRRGLGHDVLRATAVVDPGSGRPFPPAPLDEVLVSWGKDLPEVPTVTPFVVQQVLTDSPFGTVGVWHRIDRGRVVAAGAGKAPADAGPVEVTAQRRFADALAERTGRLDILDSLARGRLEGGLPKLMVLLGVYDSDECRAARRRLTTPATRPLAVLGELLSSPSWTPLADAVEATLPRRRAAAPPAAGPAAPPAPAAEAEAS